MNRISRTFYTLLMFTVLSLQTQASTLHKLVIRFTSQDEHSYVLTEKPVLTFDNDNLYITADNLELKSYPVSMVKDFYFSTIEGNGPAQQNITIYDHIEINHDNDDDPTTEITSPTTKLEFKYIGDIVSIQGLEYPQTVLIYNIQGQQTLSEKVTTDNNVTIDLSPLPSGIYIVKTETQSFKIRKK